MGCLSIMTALSILLKFLHLQNQPVDIKLRSCQIIISKLFCQVTISLNRAASHCSQSSLQKIFHHILRQLQSLKLLFHFFSARCFIDLGFPLFFLHSRFGRTCFFFLALLYDVFWNLKQLKFPALIDLKKQRHTVLAGKLPAWT